MVQTKANNGQDKKSLIFVNILPSINTPTMSKQGSEVKILQFNQMKGIQKGRTDYKDGEIFLAGQKM